MKTDKNILNKWNGLPIIRQIGRISLSLFPAHNFIMTYNRTYCARGLSVAATRLFSIAAMTLWVRGWLRRVHLRPLHSALPAP